MSFFFCGASYLIYATGDKVAFCATQNWTPPRGVLFVYTSIATGTLTYDLLDHFTQWYVSSTNQEQYLYDASGQRMLHRITNSSGTTIITFPFGIEEHQYSGSGTNQANTYYYFLAGHLLGSLDGNGTQFYLTDALGSLVSSFTNAAGGARMKSNQLFGPYGNSRYTAGNLNTAKGFIGQYNDNTGLDYFNARYYDPVAGVFLSADTAQGNAQGMNPYAYVNGNPETHSDPSGRYYTSTPFSTQNGRTNDYVIPGSGLITSVTVDVNYQGSYQDVSGAQTTLAHGNDHIHVQTLAEALDPYNPDTDTNNSPFAKLARELGWSDLQNVWGNPNSTWLDKLGAFLHFLGTNANNALQFAMIFGGGPEEDAVEGASTLAEQLSTREQYVLDNLDSLIPDHGGEGNNILFGDKVPSYNGSRPDIVTPNAIVEVTGEGPNGIPSDLAPGLRKANQLTNFVKGANPGQSVYLVYDGDISQFPEALNNFLEKWGIEVIEFHLP